jgi:SH3-like domain-containing protein
MKSVLLLLFLCLFASASFAAPSIAADVENDDSKSVSGLPLPRFASLRSDDVNLRTGPGTRYPIDWVYTHQGLPVEITAEFEYWRRVRDWEGSEGWVHKSGLSGKRTGIVTGSMRDLHKEDNPQSPVVAHLEPGATGQLLNCEKDWCRLKFDGVKGYLLKTEFWGTYQGEIF